MNEAESVAAPVVVKVGGSLFDLPHLGPHLRAWLAELASPQVLVVVGGGPTADMVRALDRTHGLGEEAAHWLALRALSFNTHLLKSLLEPAPTVITAALGNLPAFWRQGQLPLLDAYAFACADEDQSGHLPHCWEATSDSLAARVARVIGAGRLFLLKSVDIPPGLSWSEAARMGYVDPIFVGMLSPELGFEVQAINFRRWALRGGQDHSRPL
jgi:aspartokinase-like uncharacterized kinase